MVNIINIQEETNVFSVISFCCIYLIKGFTNPTAAELRILMIKHGGEFHEYLNDRVTHIIATNLAHTKVSFMRNKKVVKPEWITDRYSHISLYIK